MREVVKHYALNNSSVITEHQECFKLAFKEQETISQYLIPFTRIQVNVLALLPVSDNLQVYTEFKHNRRHTQLRKLHR